MEIAFTEESLFALQETITWDQAREQAWDKKTAVFGSRLSKLFSRPKAPDVKISYQEKRWEPLWHIRCTSRYEYDRTRHYQVPIPQAEVRTVIIDQREYIPSGEPRAFTLVGLEKCREGATVERTLDAVTGDEQAWEHYLEFKSKRLPDLAGWKPADSIVVPARIRATTVVREALSELIKPLDADTIHEDLITIEKIDLYYRPIYAFEFEWTPKERRAIAEFDGLTGELVTEGATIRDAVQKPLSPELLFDVGVDAIDLLVPGGGIAIKLAKATSTRK
jgi:hypothetical protein